MERPEVKDKESVRLKKTNFDIDSLTRREAVAYIAFFTAALVKSSAGLTHEKKKKLETLQELKDWHKKNLQKLAEKLLTAIEERSNPIGPMEVKSGRVDVYDFIMQEILSTFYLISILFNDKSTNVESIINVDDLLLFLHWDKAKLKEEMENALNYFDQKKDIWGKVGVTEPIMIEVKKLLQNL
jgi:hypothetical protein